MSHDGSMKRSAVSRKQAMKWALSVGFSERQAPWAAVCAVSLKAGRQGAPVFASEVLSNLTAQYPALFDNRAQLQLELEL